MKKFPNPHTIPVKERLRVCLEMVLSQKLAGKVLLDVGCSYGWLPSLLANKKLKKIIGADPSPDAIKAAKKNAPKAEFYLAPAEKLPVEDSVANIVTMFDVLEHVPASEEQNALKEAYRVLKPGGKLLFSTPHWNFFTNIFDPAWYIGHRHYKLKEIEKKLKAVGFKNIKIEVKGGLWFSIYLLWLYIGKRITSQVFPINSFFLKKADLEFSQKGIHTIYIVADKS